LLEGQDPVSIFGEQYRVRARIERAEGYSAHADREELLTWAGAIQAQGQLEQVFLVHGEEESCLALADALQERGVPRADVPERGQIFELGAHS
jgi:metallo-beta-lactamase family protein